MESVGRVSLGHLLGRNVLTYLQEKPLPLGLWVIDKKIDERPNTQIYT